MFVCVFVSVRRGICKHTRARARTPGAALLNPPVHSSSLRAPLASADRSVRVRAAFIAACVLCTVAGLFSNSSSAQRPQQQGSSCRRWMDYLLIHLPRVALRGHLLVSAPFCDFYAHRDCDHWSCTDLRAALTSESPRCCWCCWVDAQLISRRGAFCNKLLQTLWGAKSWCQHRLGFLWHCENFLFIHPLPLFLLPPCFSFVLDVWLQDRASSGNYPRFPFQLCSRLLPSATCCLWSSVCPWFSSQYGM